MSKKWIKCERAIRHLYPGAISMVVKTDRSFAALGLPHLHLHLPQSTIFLQQNTILSRFYCYKKPRLGLTIHSHCHHPDTQTFMKIGKSLALNQCQEQRRNELTMNLAKSCWIKLVKMKQLFPYPCPRIQIIIKLQEATLKRFKRRKLKLKDS